MEIIALILTLGFNEGCIILSYDGANVFNSKSGYRFLPTIAEMVPSVSPYAANLYAREALKILFVFDGEGLAVVESMWGYQGCKLRPLCYSTGLLAILKYFRANLTGTWIERGFVIVIYAGHSTTGSLPRHGS